ncbi:hypothetical protein [Bdellovibrio bacteriovorus]|uniref:hypothetical protein n=1 Tax=Bdellovibrio bacteriovorus TaxID=959 RepID=UPI0035A6F402
MKKPVITTFAIKLFKKVVLMKILSLSIFSVMFLYLGSLAFAAKIVKSVDGAVRQCPASVEDTVRLGDKTLLINLKNAATVGEDENLVLSVSVVQCKNGRWVQDPNPDFETYKTDDGKTVEVFYKNYRFYLLNQEGAVLLQTELTPSVQTTVNRTKEKSNVFELIVTVEKTYRVSDGYEFSRWESFGTFNLIL